MSEILLAVGGRDLEGLRRLLAAGADPDARAANGMTPLCQAVVQGDIEFVSALVEHAANVNCPVTGAARRARYPLHLAASWGRTHIAELLVAHGADPDVTDGDGVTPLCAALRDGQLSFARALLAHGADVRRACRDGTTPLHAAMEADHTDFVRELLARGADPQVRDEAGRAPSDLAVRTETLLLGLGADLAPDDVAALVAAQNAFAIALYAQCTGEGGNVCLSPSSIARALLMVWAGAEGETRRELADALCLPALDPTRIHAAAAMLATLSRCAQGVSLSVATALFAHQDASLREAFVALVRQQYGAEVRLVDFAQSERARAVIEEWGRVHSGITPRAKFNALTRLLIIDSIAFSGRWAAPFDESDTCTAPFFHLDGTSAPARFMYQRGRFAWAGIEGGRALELLYAGDAVSMVVLLPNATDGLPALERALPDALPRCLDQLDGSSEMLRELGRSVEVYLPRFRLETALDLPRALAALGIRRAFDAGRADFSGLQEHCDDERPWFVSAVDHQARVEVDEEGTRAAALTEVGVGAFGNTPPPPPVFRADHPFLFLIRDRRTASLLFLGRVLTIPPDSPTK